METGYSDFPKKSFYGFFEGNLLLAQSRTCFGNDGVTTCENTTKLKRQPLHTTIGDFCRQSHFDFSPTTEFFTGDSTLVFSLISTYYLAHPSDLIFPIYIYIFNYWLFTCQ